MIKRYRCKITPTLTSSCFRYLDNGRFYSRNIMALEKLFYFYVNDPVQPVILWNSCSLSKIEPGTNRYLGVALREANAEIDGICITDCDTIISNEVRLGDYIDSTDLQLGDSFWGHGSSRQWDEKLVNWAIGNATTLNNSEWYEPAFKWISDNLKYTWALDVNGQMHFLNQGYNFFIFPKKVKEIVKVSDHANIEEAIKHLFKKVVECELK